MGRLTRIRRPIVALVALGLIAPLAACTDDGYGPGPGYGGQYAPPPPPPPPPGGYYDDRGGPPPQGGDYGDRGAPPPPPSDYDPQRDYRPRAGYDQPMRREDYVYRGRDNRYYCRRSDGTTGTVVGAVAGGALGGIIGGSALGAILGGAGGALLGRSIDKGEVRCQ